MVMLKMKMISRTIWTNLHNFCNIVLLLNLCLYTNANSVSYIVKSFTDETNNGVINHIVVSTVTGKVYIGAVNKLYQLSENLTQEKSEVTGQKDDAPNCRPTVPCVCSWTDPGKCEDFIKKPTNSVSKALVIDYDNDRLIACSNILQGHCEKRHLSDITQKDDDIWIPMVPYDEESSVVMYIASGPSPPVRNVLYIGATRSTVGESSFRDKVNAVSSRRLDNFKLTFEDLLFGSTALNLEQSLRDIYKIYYKYGFSSGGFSYFLTVQKESAHQVESLFITKILRICQNDTKFHSYAEMQLQCTKNNVNYNELQRAFVTRPGSQLAQSLGLAHDHQTDLDEVLFGVFSVYGDDNAGSAMCMYSMRDIRRQFTAAIQTCFSGVGNTGPDYMGKAGTCTKVDIPIKDDYCGSIEINYPISGSTPIVQAPVVTFQDLKATGITVTTTTVFTVAFIGTTNGNLKKVVIESKVKAVDYETLVISEGNAVNPDLVMDMRKSHVYVVTDKQVSKVKVQDCSQYTTCYSCLGANDPYCGWCSLESRCTIQAECPKSSQPLQWLSYNGEQCTTIHRIVPEQVQIRKDPPSTTKLKLTVQNLPIPIQGTYQCAYTGLGMTPRTTTANKLPSNNNGPGGNSTLECETPPYNLLPVIPTGKDHITLNLSIRMDEKDFVSKNFTFFDCSIHSSCTSCTVSAYPCTWCVQHHKCTHDRESCGSDVLVTGKNVLGNSDNPGPQSCPRIENGFTEILVPSSKNKRVTVKAVNLQAFQSNFQCVFSIDNIPQNPVNAVLKAHNSIECERVKFESRSPSPSLHVPFKITWAGNNGQRNALDNPENIQVKVYKCEEMAGNCGECLTLDNKYNCGWCSSSKQCRIQPECTPTEWLDHSAVCPNPLITKFYPEAGPKEGGTIVTIEGENLGKVFDDIKDGISVAGESCSAVDDSFIPAFRISCRTGESTNTKIGKVEIIVSNKYRTVSNLNFTYVEPVIHSFSPNQGPASGGTRLTIRGTNLNAGTNINASLLDKPCIMIKQLPTIAICETPDNPQSQTGSILMQIDNAVIQNTGSDRFTYVADPEIKDVRPSMAIVSGGTNITVMGTGLNVISEPKMVVYYKGNNYTSLCEVRDNRGESMVCQAPTLPDSEKSDYETPIKLSYGFILDNVASVRNRTNESLNADKYKYTVYPNPTFVEFKDGVKHFHTSNDILTIEGDNISKALREEDITVTIGEASCEVTAISQKQITCKPPKPEDEGVGSEPTVQVDIGSNISRKLGTLKFESPQTSWSMPVIIGCSVVGALSIFIIVVVCVVYRRKTKENDRVMKNMRNQMDMLEAKVAKECKEAFAELQTDMTEITSDLSSGQSSIPFRDYRSFCMKVLFPNTPEEDHPVVRGLEVEYYKRGDMDKGLKNFNVLIGNKTFLLLFIRTLEQNQEFTMRERVNVASLISVALQNRMEYQTDILKTLLAELIEKSMDSRNHPKLLLRRTESVAEKMLTNWFTFLLHKFLLECAGEPLFLLYRAMKQQIDKGPVDAVSSEARYSLSEDKLIRQQTDFRPLTICVRDLDQGYNMPQQQHLVKVLDCDSISQVKDKILDTIYKNQPFSRRPDKDDLDLEWHTGVQGRLILKDEDVTSKADGEYKKLNTLAHYKVPDQAVMALVHKQTSMYNISSLTSSDRSGSQSHFYNTIPGTYGGSPSLSRSMSPNTITIDVDNHSSKTYHLVKPSDSDTQKEGDRGNKMVSEIYLTRLLTTKGTLQQFVDDLFETIFSTASRDSALPLAIKYMFDFLDDQALHHGITDPEVVHTWKSNSLPLRFWVNVVKNPDFVFDIHKSNIVDSCLTVVGQTFMDSCSMSEHRLGKDSPSSKLLYAKDIPKYKRWVERYYQDIKQMPAISDQDMNATLADESRQHKYDFCVNAALNELYQFVVRYNKELMVSLEEDEFAKSYRLAARLESVHQAMEVTV